MDRSTFRESGSSDSHRPTPPGDFNGSTRRQALTDLLAKHEDPTKHVPAHQFWTRRFIEMDMAPIERRVFREFAPWPMRLRMFLARAFRVTAVLVVSHLVLEARANACTIKVVKHNEATSAGCTAAATPQDAADVMAKVDSPANVTDRDFAQMLPRGPYIFIMKGGDRYETDFARAAYNAARDRWLQRYPGGINSSLWSGRSVVVRRGLAGLPVRPPNDRHLRFDR